MLKVDVINEFLEMLEIRCLVNGQRIVEEELILLAEAFFKDRLIKDNQTKAILVGIAIGYGKGFRDGRDYTNKIQAKAGKPTFEVPPEWINPPQKPKQKTEAQKFRDSVRECLKKLALLSE